MTRGSERSPFLLKFFVFAAGMIMLLGVAAAALPDRDDATPQQKLERLKDDLARVRTQLALYHEHHGSWPPGPGDQMKSCMVLYSNRNHVTAVTEIAATGFVYGPYMLEFPENPFTHSDVVVTRASIRRGGWYYNPANGEFRTDDGEHDQL